MGTVATPGGEAVEKLSKTKQEHMWTHHRTPDADIHFHEKQSKASEQQHI